MDYNNYMPTSAHPPLNTFLHLSQQKHAVKNFTHGKGVANQWEIVLPTPGPPNV